MSHHSNKLSAPVMLKDGGLVLLDNTVLTNFAQVEQMDLIRYLWGTPGTTIEVKQEYQHGVSVGKVPSNALDDLNVITLTEQETADASGRFSNLGAGERTCLAVALHRRGLLVTDDRPARRIAARLGVRVTGTIGILVLCVVQDLLTLPEANALLQAMITLGYYSPATQLEPFLPE
ncbi:MAG: DUF3368 domain-containing protein [Chloroflexi bacterium]|nr:DUF3368 domain-containing protein [Chloroflexota bacterium]